MQLGHGTVHRILARLGVGARSDHGLARRGDSSAQALADPEPFPGHDGAFRPVGCHSDQLVAHHRPQSGTLDLEQVGGLLRDPRKRLSQSRPELGSRFDRHRAPKPMGTPDGYTNRSPGPPPLHPPMLRIAGCGVHRRGLVAGATVLADVAANTACWLRVFSAAPIVLGAGTLRLSAWNFSWTARRPRYDEQTA